MLSDERIRQIAEDIYCSEGTRAEIEHSIRAALAESAQVPKQDLSVCQCTAPKRIYLCVSDDEADHNRAFNDGYDSLGVTWAEDAPVAVCVEYVRADLAAAQVPVMEEAVAEAYVYEDVDGDDILGLRLLREDYPMQHGERLYTAPIATSITAAELERLRKDAGCKEELVRTMRHLRKTLEKIDKYRFCMSYNDSYFGEPEGTVKRVCSELQHCIDAAIAAEGEK